MEIEIYETEIGTFKITPQVQSADMLFVQTFILLNGKWVWEDVGYMRRKEFLKLIKPHNPKKKDVDEKSADTFWQFYGSIDI